MFRSTFIFVMLFLSFQNFAWADEVCGGTSDVQRCQELQRNQEYWYRLVATWVQEAKQTPTSPYNIDVKAGDHVLLNDDLKAGANSYAPNISLFDKVLPLSSGRSRFSFKNSSEINSFISISCTIPKGTSLSVIGFTGQSIYALESRPGYKIDPRIIILQIKNVPPNNFKPTTEWAGMRIENEAGACPVGLVVFGDNTAGYGNGILKGKIEKIQTEPWYKFW